jgi:hypothetical protein
MMIKRTRNIDTIFLITLQHLEKPSISTLLAILSFNSWIAHVLVPALALLLVFLEGTLYLSLLYMAHTANDFLWYLCNSGLLDLQYNNLLFLVDCVCKTPLDSRDVRNLGGAGYSQIAVQVFYGSS